MYPPPSDSRPNSNLIARVSPRTTAKEGERVRLRVDTDRVHAFDPDSGLSIWGKQS